MTTESNPHPTPDPSGDPPAPAATPAGAPPAGAPPAGGPPTGPPPVGWATQPPPPYPPRPAGPSAPVGWVIAAMLLFWPTGIPALLASHRAARAIGAGDEPTATLETATAKRWGIVSVCVGAGLIVLSFLVSLVWVIFAAVAVQHFDDDGTWNGPGWTERSEPAFPFDSSGHPDLQERGGPTR